MIISSPVHSILPPKKMSKLGGGSAFPSGGAMLGSSPELHHKDARDGQYMGEAISHQGSSHEHSAMLMTQPGSLQSFSDGGSSNAFRPITPEMMSEKSN